MKTRLDADKVEIVNIEEIRTEYPSMPKNVFDAIESRFAWDIKDEIVMAVEDLKFALTYIDRGFDINNKEDLDYEWHNRNQCAVCGEYLLSVDEVYQDEMSGDALCDRHSIMNDITNNYRAITENEIEVNNHCSNCKFCERVDFVVKDDIIQEVMVCQYYTEDNDPTPCYMSIDKCKIEHSLSN